MCTKIAYILGKAKLETEEQDKKDRVDMNNKEHETYTT